MAYDENLAVRIRKYLSERKEFQVQEKRMFDGLAFMVNDKMCINVGDQRLMRRFDPDLTESLSTSGFCVDDYEGKRI